MRTLPIGLCATLLLLGASEAAGLTINIDIGDVALYTGTGGAPDAGTVWNEYDMLGGSLAGLVDSFGNPTGAAFSLQVTPLSVFEGTPPLSNALLDDVILLWGSESGNELYPFQITGLLPNTRYDLYGYGLEPVPDAGFGTSDPPAPPQPFSSLVVARAAVSDGSGAIEGTFMRPFTLTFVPLAGLSITQVPEPSAALLLGALLLAAPGLGLRGRSPGPRA